MPAASRARTPSITGTADTSTSAASPEPDEQLAQVTEQSEPGDVGGRVHHARLEREGGVAPPAFSVVITRIASATSSGGAASRFSAVEITPRPIGLVSTSTSPARAVRLVSTRRGVDGADDREAVLRFGVVDGVTAADERARGAHDVVPAVEHARQQLERQPLARPRDEVEREQRRAAHRVHVGERVGGGDAAPVVGVVDDRREEVGGDDDREVVAQAVDRGVVGGVEADEQVGVRRRVAEAAHEAEHGAQVGGRELAGAARAV